MFGPTTSSRLPVPSRPLVADRVVTGTVLVDLTTTKPEYHRKRIYFALTATPDGAKVIVVVGTLVPGATIDALEFLTRHVGRVDIEIQGDPGAVRDWHEALTSPHTHPVLGAIA